MRTSLRSSSSISAISRRRSTAGARRMAMGSGRKRTASTTTFCMSRAAPSASCRCGRWWGWRRVGPAEVLSPHGLRALSRYHADHRVEFDLGGMRCEVDYEPAESTTGLFGGNSNWRGPVWFPVNYLLIEALREFHKYMQP